MRFCSPPDPLCHPTFDHESSWLIWLSYHQPAPLEQLAKEWTSGSFCLPSVNGFRLLCSDLFLIYVQHFDIVCQPHPTNVSPVTGMHMLKWVVSINKLEQWLGELGELAKAVQSCTAPHSSSILLMRGNGQCIGEVIPLVCICSPAHLVPNFSHEAHSHLMSLSSYELSNEFWLNKYWLKDFYYTLSST